MLRVIARMNVGGPALQVTALTRHLDPSRFETRLLVGTVEPGEADYVDLRAPDLLLERVPGLGRSVRATGDIRALAAVYRAIRQFRPDVVHTHTAKAGVLGRLAAIAHQVPVIVHTFHGHLLHGYFSPRVTRAVVLTERTLARRTSKLVAVGEQVRDDLLRAGVGRPDQYVVVPPGVAAPPHIDVAAARSELGLPTGVPVVALVARLTKIKRPDRFVDVAAQVARSRPDVCFVVAGEGELLAETQSLAKERGVPIAFVGWRRDVHTVYAACDLVLLTSDNEGMPVSLIEASASGRACVTTDVGSADEVVLHDSTGLVVAPDADALATAVLELIEDHPRRLRMAEAARRHAEDRFGERRLVTQTEHLYEELISQRRVRLSG